MSFENTNEIISTVVDTNVVVAEKQKKPTLAGKYSKFLTFGFWLASILPEEIKNQLFDIIHLYDTVDEQTELFERFLNEEKTTAKTMRKIIAEHNKPPKATKAKATRKTKAVVHQDELISQLVADANADPVVTENLVKDAKAEEKARKEAEKLAK